MSVKKIIPCLDVCNGQVVKGVEFRNHEIMGDILPLAEFYAQEGADELVLYDITASIENRTVEPKWISAIVEKINIPFCVAGGIRSIEDAEKIFGFGANKISINSPAIENPDLINQLVDKFGSDRIVVGIDSYFNKETGEYTVYQFTGNEKSTQKTNWNTFRWIEEVQKRGAGEIVLNMMNQDGVRDGYDLEQLKQARAVATSSSLVASGGAGTMAHFYDAFSVANVDGALSASAFHKKLVNIKELKQYLNEKGIKVNLC